MSEGDLYSIGIDVRREVLVWRVGSDFTV